MISEKTVLILGAGASCDYGFPIGNSLICSIIANINRYLSNGTFSPASRPIFDNLANTIIRNDPANIDKFLRDHCDSFGEMTRIMIAATILDRESTYETITSEISPLGTKDNSKADRFGFNWLKFVINSLTEKCSRPEDINQNKLSIITFNYDMSLEYYLLNNLLSNSKFKNEASNYIKNLDIIHLYGSLRGASYDLDNLLQEYGAYDKFNFDDKDSCIVNRARELYRRDYQTGRMASLIWID